MMTKFSRLKSEPSRTELVNELQRIFNKFIRERDKGKPCIYCGKDILKSGEHVATAAHYLPVSTSAALRFEPLNVHLAGLICNFNDDRKAYRENLVRRIGDLPVRLLEMRQHSLEKLTREEIVEKIQHFKTLLLKQTA